jgi:hypothetical protein
VPDIILSGALQLSQENNKCQQSKIKQQKIPIITTPTETSTQR